MKYISNIDHYKKVLLRVQTVKHTLWIGTADIKDLYGRWQRQEAIALIDHLICHDVEERFIHEKEPVPNFRKDYDKSFAEISDLILTNPYEGIT